DFADGDHLWGIIEIPINNNSPTLPLVREATNGDSRYVVSTSHTTWQNAQNEAVSLGGRLVTLNDAAEEAWIRQTFGNVPLWIGLNDAASEGQFIWSSGQNPAYRNFAPGEPNNHLHTSAGEDYVVMNYNAAGQWNDYAAADHQWGLIEIPIGDPTPSGIALAISELLAEETAGTARVGITRTGGLNQTVTVRYRTVDATARAGLDYTAVSGTAVFNPGETLKTITIPILDDALAEGNETFSFVIDDVTGNASLLAPRTAVITIRDDEVPISRLFGMSSFNDSSLLWLNGGATLVGGALRLTQAVTNQAGGAYYKSALEVTPGTSFSTRFSFRITGGTTGADGLTFVLQNAPAARAALGLGGGGLGYAEIPRSLAVEFDTYRNEWDADANHASLLVNGNVAAPLRTIASSIDFNSGGTVYSWIDYDAKAKRLNLFLSTTAAKPAQPTLSHSVDLAAIVGGAAFVGFTAGTGGVVNVHEIRDWEFSASSSLLPPPPPPVTVITETLHRGLVAPTALAWSNDGRNLYVAEQRGTVRVVRDGALLGTFALDFRDRVNGVRDRGLLDVAVNPNLATNPYLYLAYTYDPPEVYQHVGDPLAGPDQKGNRPARISRVTLDASTNHTTIVPNSEVILVGKNSTWANVNAFKNSTDDLTVPPAGVLPDGTNLQDFIATDSESHTIGALAFGKDGMLYATIGDGTSYNRVDPRTTRVQDVDNLSGKLLRIDPITGAGLPDNPFFNGNPNANRSKVYQLGLRNAFRMGIDPVTGRIYLGDVGWATWEEINTGPAGANFGWPYFEGGVGTSLRANGYQDLAQAQQFYASGTPITPPVLALSHEGDGINAIVISDVYRGTAYPSRFQGGLFYNDLARGIVKAVTFTADGQVASIESFASGAVAVVQMRVGPNGLLYFVDLDDGTVGRWVLQ
ncbi:MAG: PQQ-dependent sugar dehydrogenase, partial [Isosphaeraceae bacterium]